MILSCSSICKSFGSDDILKNASFHIEEHEKAAIVGINGAGKSTLLKIITGELPADSGEVVISKGKTLGYLAQNQDLLSHRTIYDEMLEVKRPVIEMEERLRELLERVLESPFEKQGGTENDHREETGPAGGDDGAARRLPDAGNRP